jgi:hypothetical protein
MPLRNENWIACRFRLRSMSYGGQAASRNDGAGTSGTSLREPANLTIILLDKVRCRLKFRSTALQRNLDF